MKNFMLLIAALFCGSTALASTFPSSLDGTYDCQSIEIGTHELYKGTVTIKQTGQTYALKSHFEDGSHYVGTGIYDQDKGIFSAAFINPKNAKENGVALAIVKENADLSSRWTYMNKKEVGTSECIKRV